MVYEKLLIKNVTSDEIAWNNYFWLLYFKYSDVEKDPFYILFKDTAMTTVQRDFIFNLYCEGTVPLFNVYLYDHSWCLKQGNYGPHMELQY